MKNRHTLTPKNITLFFALFFPHIGYSQVQTAGETVLFSDIEVRGNTENSTSSILDLCSLSPATRFSEADLSGALSCLAESGKFEAVDFDVEGSVLVISVSELPNYSGFLDVGLSADSERGLSANLYIEKQDFFTEELSASLSTEISESSRYLGATLFDEDLWGTGMSGGYTLDYDLQDSTASPYNIEQFEISAFINLRDDEASSYRLRGGMLQTDLFKVSSPAGQYLMDEVDESTRIFAALDMETRGTYDVGRLPEADYRVRASQELTYGLDGGSMSKTTASVMTRTEFDDGRLQIGASFNAGHIAVNSGERSSISDRFFLGGDSLRGFAPRGIGPVENGNMLGGNSFASLRLEGDVRVISLANFELRSGLFADMGSVWNLDQAPSGLDASASRRSTAGVSLTVTTGEIPIDLYYAFPVESVATDEEQRFGFALSRNF